MVMPSWKNSPVRKNRFGFLYKGLFDEWHDTALISISDPEGFSNSLSNDVTITDVLDIIDDETFINSPVTMYGGFSGIKEGKIISVNSSQRGKINGIEFTKSDLIQTSKISKPGDSGSPVLIGDKLVGMIIGADSGNSYVLSAANILSYFKH